MLRDGLFGLVAGAAGTMALGITTYGDMLLRGRAASSVPAEVAGIALGLLAMIASDLPIALSGASDPRTWTPVDWASDLIPHLIYGLVTVETFGAISRAKD